MAARRGRDGRVALSTTGSRVGVRARLLNRAAGQKARAHGLSWDATPITLTPAPKLAGLIRKSREVAASGEAEVEP